MSSSNAKHLIVALTAIMAALLMLGSVPVVLADEGSIAAPDAVIPELFYESDPAGSLDVVASATPVAELPFADGRAYFVVLPDGQVGIVAIGQVTLRAINLWMDNVAATPLEVFGALGGNVAEAPAELRRDHLERARENPAVGDEPRTLPGLDELFALPRVAHTHGGFWHDWIVDSQACGDEDLGLFWYWFQYYDYDVWGAQGVSGHGEWTGQANITLGGTSDGVITVCFYDGGIADLDIVEYIPNMGWVHIMDIPNFGEWAYGYIFQGYGIRHVRMEVRDPDHPEPYEPSDWNESFFWAASY